MTFTAENFKDQIPYYLTAAPKQKALVENLERIVSGAQAGYYLEANENEHLQGDGWRGLPLLSFATGERRDVRGVLLSNTCDVSPENQRSLPTRLTFAPIVRLSLLEYRFTERGLSADQIHGKIKAIKDQTLTSMFFLPAGGALEEDHVVLLDDIHSLPIVNHDPTVNEKLFTLSMAGFYLFIFKLSIHFCRLHEDLDRSPAE